MDNYKFFAVETLPYFLLVAAFAQLVYLIVNISLQRKTEKKLEALLKINKNEFHKMLSSYNAEEKILHFKGENSKTNFTDLIMLTFVKNHINELEKSERIMMNKVIERKNTENQMRYINKLISDIGFDGLLKNKNARIPA